MHAGTHKDPCEQYQSSGMAISISGVEMCRTRKTARWDPQRGMFEQY